MELTVVNDLGQPFAIDVNPNMYLEQIRALVEAEVYICSRLHLSTQQSNKSLQHFTF